MEFIFNNMDEALIGMSQEILTKGVRRKTRGFDCLEFPEPVRVTIEDPTSRMIKNPARKWSKTLPVVESLWLLNGVNEMSLPKVITKNIMNFSDDGVTMRAGYGPRIRGFSGIAKDYNVSDPRAKGYLGRVKSGDMNTVDQLKYVVEVLKKDRNSRQASITIHDPVKDCYNLDGTMKETKDQPCTRLIQFMMVDGKLDCTVYMRSNDLLWGFSAVNVYNFTLMQEIVAGLVGMPIGRYHHIANNLHIYDNFHSKITEIADSKVFVEHKPFYYSDVVHESFESFDLKLERAFRSAYNILYPEISENPYASLVVPTVCNDLLDDLLLQIYGWKNKTLNDSNFHNPKMR